MQSATYRPLSTSQNQSAFRLIVTADDFGIGVATSKGIIEAHLNGPVTCTSMMTTTGDLVKQSIDLLSSAPNLEIGLHLVLTSGEKPLAALPGSGLVTREGQFGSNGRLWGRALLGRLDERIVFDEIAAQAEAFVRLLGRKPAYVDGHHHSHQLPIIRQALLRAIQEGLLPPLTRVTAEPAWAAHVSCAKLRRRAARFLASGASASFAPAGVKSNDSFFGMLDPSDLSRPFPWQDYFVAMEPALTSSRDTDVVEWVVHPGLADPTLQGRDPYTLERIQEHTALTDQSYRYLWDRPEIQLITKSQINPPANHRESRS